MSTLMNLPDKVVLSAEHIVKLLQIKRVGKSIISKLHELLLASTLGSITEDILFDALMDNADVLCIPGLTKSDIFEGFVKGEMLLAESDKMNIRIISYFDNAYPSSLRLIESPPLILNLIGDPNLLTLPSIALIGTRKPSNYGKLIAGQLAAYLVGRNLNLVTGIESGCNSIGAKACVEAGGKLIAVLPTGLDAINNKDYKKIAESIIENDCCIVSEYMLGSKDLSSFLSNRMRLVTALAESVLVVETDIDSETMKLAHTAQRYNKKLFAFDHPEDKLNDKSRGNQLLISRGDAISVKNYSDILL